LTGTAAPDPVLAGSNVTYSLSVANLGSIDAHSVVLTDQLPAGVTLVSATSSQGYIAPNMGGNSLTATLMTIPAGGNAAVTIVVQTGAGSVGTIVDTASVTSQETDPSPASESISLATKVELAADLSIAMTARPAPVLLLGDVTYSISVTNLGPSTATSVI